MNFGNFSKKLRQLRLNLGLNQREVSARTGISQATISRLEAGVALPSYQTLIKISGTFGVQVDDLLMYSDEHEEKI